MPRRCLVVESHPDVASVMTMSLDRARYRVSVVGSLAAARRALAKARPPHIIVLEVVLPDGDGLEFCREAKARHPGLPVLVVTTRVQSRDEVLDAGADRFMSKPFEPDAFSAAVEALLGPAGGGRVSRCRGRRRGT